MLILALLLAGADSVDDGAAALARYHAMTAADHRCVVDPRATDITVCGLRNADRFRVPFVGPEPGSPQIQDVHAERERLFARTDNCDEKSIFLIGCGSAGVTYSTRSGLQTNGVRKLAP